MIVIIGAGAAGTFAALKSRETLDALGIPRNSAKIIILEKGRTSLRKVKISGGGRCNVTHRPHPHREFVEKYPRGKRELLSPLHTFNSDTVMNWFRERGVELKIEEDGRVFPKSNSSQTIIDCFEKQKELLEIETVMNAQVEEIQRRPSSFLIKTRQGKEYNCKSLIIATGSDKSGHKLAEELGHTLSELAPSLFTFKTKHPYLKEMQGTSFKKVEVSLKVGGKKFKEIGPMLITHWGLSGPAILKLSAFAARELKHADYKFPFRVNFLSKSLSDISSELRFLNQSMTQKKCKNSPPEGLTKKFWSNLIEQLLENSEKPWGELSQKEINKIAETLFQCEFQSLGSHRYKEEFVECGGINSKEIDFKTMESKSIEGLFFAGELLDVDGVTGGFNFQNCWTTGFLAGENAANFASSNAENKQKD